MDSACNGYRVGENQYLNWFVKRILITPKKGWIFQNASQRLAIMWLNLKQENNVRYQIEQYSK